LVNAKTHQKSINRIQIFILKTSTKNLLTTVKIITFKNKKKHFPLFKTPPTLSVNLNYAEKPSKGLKLRVIFYLFSEFIRKVRFLT
jgi:hypothetical protein